MALPLMIKDSKSASSTQNGAAVLILPVLALLLPVLVHATKTRKNVERQQEQGMSPPSWAAQAAFDRRPALLLGSMPHVAFRDLSNKYGPLMYLKLGQVPTIVVSSAELAKEVMKTHDLALASRPELLATKIVSYEGTDIALSPYGEYWRQVRKICTLELFSMKRVQSFRSLRQEETLKLARQIASSAGSPVNLTENVYSSANEFTSRAVFGFKTKQKELFLVLVQEVIKMASGFDLADVYPGIKWLQEISGTKSKLVKLHHQVDKILENIINEHKLNKTMQTGDGSQRQDDLVDVLLRCQEDGHDLPLTTDNIKAVIWDVFSGGSETSATVVTWAMAEMLKNPRVLKKGQDEVRHVFKDKGYVDETCFHQLEYLKSVIKETLRLHPVLPLLLPRECRQTCKINGCQIPVKARVIVNVWAISRDPELWYDAESFIPERFLDSSVDFKGNNFEYTPFGAGRRMCPGISFGNANVEIQLAMLLYYFDWSLPDGMEPEHLSMTEKMGATVGRKDDLVAIPTVKIPLPIH